jgi:hexosaminidase
MRGLKNKHQKGFYTQAQIREIVAYAKARCIEILPEIDLPAHAKAAVTAYPDMLLDPHDTSHFRSVQKITGNTINPARESTYTLFEGVLKEMASLFPFGYIHLGGDEIPKGAWSGSPAVKKLMHQKNLKSNKEVENYFFSRMDRIAAKYGKHIAGWQEITEGRPAIRRSSLIIAWQNPKAGKKIIQKGYPTIMAPVQYLYFDQQYARSKKEPGHTWSTPISLYKVYSFTPPSQTQGMEACLWSETLLNAQLADYLTWPRALALSEIAWCTQKNWKDFKRRVKEKALPRLKVQGVHYRKQ